MKCINNKRIDRKRQQRQRRKKRQARAAAIMIMLVLLISAGALGGFLLWDSSQNYTLSYEETTYNKALYQGKLFAQDLCVSSEEVPLDGFEPDSELHAAGLFDLSEEKVLCGYKIYDKVYPASTTKILTAYLALKYGNVDDTVTVSEHATDFGWDASVAGLKPGETLTLYVLLCGLMIRSGNDCATAIAEYISESEEAFAELMNKEAAALGATGTHFTNPHGLHEDDHYTTAYDLYLIFNECIKDQRFVEIISMDSYTADITATDGTVRAETWTPTNYYSAGITVAPENVRVIGGKTGTENLAGNCLILFDENTEGKPYISVIMGAPDKGVLYEEMNELFSAGII